MARSDLVSWGTPPMMYFPLRPGDFACPSLEGVTLMVRAAPGVDALSAGAARDIGTGRQSHALQRPERGGANSAGGVFVIRMGDGPTV